jgi:hypothetical protein
MDVLLTILHVIGGAIVANAPFLVGFLLPPFVEIINKDVHKEWERFTIAGVCCFLVAIVLHWNDIAMGNPEAVIAYSAIIFAESQTIFKLYFAKSWMRGIIQSKLGSREDRESINPEAQAAIASQTEILPVQP